MSETLVTRFEQLSSNLDALQDYICFVRDNHVIYNRHYFINFLSYIPQKYCNIDIYEFENLSQNINKSTTDQLLLIHFIRVSNQLTAMTKYINDIINNNNDTTYDITDILTTMLSSINDIPQNINNIKWTTDELTKSNEPTNNSANNLTNELLDKSINELSDESINELSDESTGKLIDVNDVNALLFNVITHCNQNSLSVNLNINDYSYNHDKIMNQFKLSTTELNSIKPTTDVQLINSNLDKINGIIDEVDLVTANLQQIINEVKPSTGFIINFNMYTLIFLVTIMLAHLYNTS
jgi:methyl-accepting chemotaxis protein